MAVTLETSGTLVTAAAREVLAGWGTYNYTATIYYTIITETQFPVLHR